MRERLVYILKHNRPVQFLYRKTLSLFFRFVGLFIKTDKNLVLISSWAGKKYGDSPKILFEAMRSDERFKHLKYVWAFERPEDFSIENAKSIKIDSWAYFTTALKAKVWITSINIERGLTFKKKNTIYINTWHGAGTKKIGNACSGRMDYDLSNVNMMLVQSSFEKEIFLRDFKCKPEGIRMVGFPRNDKLFHITETDKARYRERFNIPKGKKVILYAPTWRDSRNGGISYDFIPPIQMEKWENTLSDEFVMLFRMHTFTTKFEMRYNDFARDCSGYENLNHILSISDIVITDYSTIIYDCSVARIPFICFGFDYERYSKERGFYFDLNKVYPGGVFHTEDEVIKRITAVLQGEDNNLYEAFRAKYIEAGGSATESVLQELNILISNE